MKMEKDNLMLEEKLYQDFNYDFACLRHSLGLTQQEMADKCNVLRDKHTKKKKAIQKQTLQSSNHKRTKEEGKKNDLQKQLFCICTWLEFTLMWLTNFKKDEENETYGRKKRHNYGPCQ